MKALLLTIIIVICISQMSKAEGVGLEEDSALKAAQGSESGGGVWGAKGPLVRKKRYHWGSYYQDYQDYQDYPWWLLYSYNYGGGSVGCGTGQCVWDHQCCSGRCAQPSKIHKGRCA